MSPRVCSSRGQPQRRPLHPSDGHRHLDEVDLVLVPEQPEASRCRLDDLEEHDLRGHPTVDELVDVADGRGSLRLPGQAHEAFDPLSTTTAVDDRAQIQTHGRRGGVPAREAGAG